MILRLPFRPGGSPVQRWRRWLLVLLVLGGVAAAFAAAPAAPANPPVPAGLDARLWQRAVALTHRCLVIDTHCDGTGRMEKPGFDFTVWHDDGHVDLAKMRQGGLDAEFMALFIAPRLEGADAVPEALGQLEAFLEQVEGHPAQLVLA